MDLLISLLNVSIIHLLMAIVPGPNTVLVSFTAASLSRSSGLLSAAGVVVASLIWVTLSLSGIIALLLKADILYQATRLVGAAYLVYTGIRIFRAIPTSVQPENSRPVSSRHSPFVAGVFTTLSNPKSAIFWVSVFALLVPGGAPLWYYCAVVAIITVQSTIWYGFVALVLSTSVVKRNYAGLSSWIDKVAGGVMIVFGLKLANELRKDLLNSTF